jgi:ABC-2 type transport system permease protein
MPIFDQGYQHWQGRLSGHAWRGLTITLHGVRAQFRHRGTKVVVVTALGPALALAGAVIVWGLIEQRSSLLAPFLPLIESLPEAIRDGPRGFRTTIWSLAFYFFFQVQLFFSMLLVVFVGPNLISQDLRFNAIPLYFSRPLRRADYFLGKLGVIGVYLTAVSIIPVVLAYLVGICFSLDFSVVKDTARLFASSIAYGLVVVASAGMLMLALSSLSRNSRYVGAMWVGVWLVSDTVAAALHESVKQRWCLLVSYTTNLKRLCGSLLDVGSAYTQIARVFPEKGRPDFATLADPFPWYWSAGVLAVLFGLSLWTLTFRVKTLDRLK